MNNRYVILNNDIVMDIYLYTTEDNRIEIRFDSISEQDDNENFPIDLYEKFSHPHQGFDYFSAVLNIQGADSILQNIIKHTDSKYISLTNITTSNPVSCKIKDSNSNEYTKSSVTYQLPTLPHLALNLLGLFTYYIYRNDTIKCLHIYEDLPSDSDLTTSMDYYVSKKNVFHQTSDIGTRLAEKLISLLYGNEKYKDVRSVLQKVFYSHDAKSFIEKIAIEKRCHILHHDLIRDFKTQESQEDQKKLLSAISDEYKNEQEEFVFLLKSLICVMRKESPNCSHLHLLLIGKEQAKNWQNIRILESQLNEFQYEMEKGFRKTA